MMITVAVTALAVAALGTVPSVSLDWEDVTCAIEKGGQKRLLLDGVCGSAHKGRITAIMGPSGAGKTVLLNSLCGQVRASPGLSLEGTLRVNGVEYEPDELPLAYVKQEDRFFAQMTVRETLVFNAKLRLGANATEAEIGALTESLLGTLGLTKSADTPVGDSTRRGVSGGERKRLAIACELISEPPLLFLDEPLSGLDSFQANNVMARLRALADRGHTVVITLHQPSAALYRNVDDLVLLSEGKLMYSGPTTGVSRWLSAAAGAVRPRDVPAAEHMLDAVSMDYSSPEAERASRERVATLAEAARGAHVPPAPPRLGRRSNGPLQPRSASRAPKAAVGVQFRLLFQRAWREVVRAKGVFLIKVAQQVMIALIYGGIYTLDDSQRSVQDRLGLLSLIAVGASNLAVAGTIRAFPKEKSLVVEERSKNLYGVGAYFASKLISDVPVSGFLSALFGALIYPLTGLQRKARKFLNFLGLVALESFASSALGLLLGSVAPSTDAALAMFPPIVVLMVIFNGFNINPESVPKPVRWMPEVSLIRWAFEGFAVNEFTGLKLKPLPKRAMLAAAKAGSGFVSTGEQALENLSFGRSTVRRCAVAQGSIIAGCWLGSLRALQVNRPRMARMRAPSQRRKGGPGAAGASGGESGAQRPAAAAV